MTDCTKTLHAILRDPDELQRAQSDLIRAWADAIAWPKKERTGRMRATGEALRGVRCQVARRVIEKTEIYWSGK